MPRRRIPLHTFRLSAETTTLPELTSFLVRKRLANGWDPGDPLLTVNLDGLAREAQYWGSTPSGCRDCARSSRRP